MQASLSFTDKLEQFLQRLFDKNTHTSEDYAQRMDTLKQAHSFAGAQMITIKRLKKNIDQQEIQWLEEAICMYLVGAVDLIGKQLNCSIKERMQLIQRILKSNVSVSSEKAIFYFNEALHRQAGSDADAMIRAGAKAAKQWLDMGVVQPELSLREQLDLCGVLV